MIAQEVEVQAKKNKKKSLSREILRYITHERRDEIHKFYLALQF
jgi:hypothetical protein